MELAEDHKQCATASHIDQSRLPQTATRRHTHDANDYRYSHRDDNDDRLIDEYRCSHPGERLIARELLEQQQREEELRRYWRKMGFKLNDNNNNNFNNNSDDGNNDKTQRHHNDDDDDEQRQEIRRRSASRNTADSFADYKKQTDDDEHIHTHAASHNGVSKADKSSSCTVRVYVSSPASAPTQSLKTSVSVTQESHKPTKKLLLPLKSDSFDEQWTGAPLFDPRQEISQQRDVRGARERETTLCSSRRLTTLSHDDAPKSTLDADGTAQQRDDDYQALSRRCARNRLTAELQRDRGRELELRCSRIIRSMSEERAGNRPKFVDVRLSEAPATIKHHSATDAELERDRDVHSKSKHKATAASMTGEKVSANCNRMPPVLRRYAYPYSDWQNSFTTDTSATPSHVSPKPDVEKEMTEPRRRENEFRFCPRVDDNVNYM